MRQFVRRYHFVPSVSGCPSRRADSVGVRLEQEETRRQVPPTGWIVREYEHTGGTDGQHVQAVRHGVRETILTAIDF